MKALLLVETIKWAGISLMVVLLSWMYVASVHPVSDMCFGGLLCN